MGAQVPDTETFWSDRLQIALCEWEHKFLTPKPKSVKAPDDSTVPYNVYCTHGSWTKVENIAPESALDLVTHALDMEMSEWEWTGMNGALLFTTHG